MSEEISPYYKPQLKTRVVMTFGMLGILAVFIVWLSTSSFSGSPCLLCIWRRVREKRVLSR